MIKCKLCGTANFPNSSVCAKCGAELETSWYNTDTYSNNEIFSDTKAECMPRSTEQRDLFSSGEKYEKMKKGVVLKKIYKQEQAMGEVTELEQPPEPEEVVPIVISRQSTSDIVRKNKGSKGKSGASYSKIPQRKIEPVDTQRGGYKVKTQKSVSEDDDNKKVELTVSDDVSSIRKNNSENSTRKSNGNNRSKKPNKNTSSPDVKSAESTVYAKNKKAQTKPKNTLYTDGKNAVPKTKSGSNTNNRNKNISKPEPKIIKNNSSKNDDLAKQAQDSKPSKTINSQNKNKTYKNYSALPKSESAAPTVAKGKKKNVPKNKKTGDKVNAVSNKQKSKVSNSSSGRYLSVGFTESDVDTNKYIAALSYIGILLIIPLFKSRSSDFCKAHSKQGTAVFIYSIIIILCSLSGAIGFHFLIPMFLRIEFAVYNILNAVIICFALILLLIPAFSGLISALCGEYRSVPIVGKFVNKNKNK